MPRRTDRWRKRVLPPPALVFLAILWLALGLLAGCGAESPVDYHDPIPWPPPGYA